MNCAGTKNRTRDLLITKHIYKLTIYINQPLTILATAKPNVTQPQSAVFQPQSGTNLAQSITPFLNTQITLPLIVSIIAYSGQLLQQLRQCRLHRVPHDVKVDLKITMRNAVAHTAHTSPWYFLMRLNKFSATIHYFRRSFADDNKTHNDSLLRSLVSKKVVLVQAFNEAACVHCSLIHVIEIVRKAVHSYTGRASANT